MWYSYQPTNFQSIIGVWEDYIGFRVAVTSYPQQVDAAAEDQCDLIKGSSPSYVGHGYSYAYVS